MNDMWNGPDDNTLYNYGLGKFLVVEGGLQHKTDCKHDTMIDRENLRTRNYDISLDLSKKHLIQRRNGARFYRRYKCIKCGERMELNFPWLRRYYYSETSLTCDYRLHEQCCKCGRTTSWAYRGEAPAGFKEKALPDWKLPKDLQRDLVYKWQSASLVGQIGMEHNGLFGYAAETPADYNDEKAKAGFKIVDLESLNWFLTVQSVNQLFDSYGMKRCEVLKGAKTDKKSWMRGRSVMKIAEGWGQAHWLILHEFGHAVKYALEEQTIVTGRRSASHGSLYCAVFCCLLEEFSGLNAWAEKTLMESAGLKVDNIDETRRLMDLLRAKGAHTQADDEDEEVADA